MVNSPNRLFITPHSPCQRIETFHFKTDCRVMTKLGRVVKEYAARSTVHGISYIFDKRVGFLDRALWLLTVLGATTLALWMVSDSFSHWQMNQVITTLKTTTKPVTDLEFPAVTICADGQHLGLVEKVLFDMYSVWYEEQTLAGAAPSLDKFMEELYQIDEEGESIMNILSTMIAPEAAGTNAVRGNQIACKDSSKRKKRSAYDYGPSKLFQTDMKRV